MRVLSIQSHVVHGYVGNKSAVFPLQLLGFDVDVINSVQFSNHTGYAKKWEGDVLNGEQLGLLLDGMERNDLLRQTGHLLTGYIGSESFLRSVLNVLNKLKKYNKNLTYVCDPVLGDNGKLYVPKELVDIYWKEVVPLANVVTPNQFEVEQLTGISIKNIDDAKKAINILHDCGPELVVITSMVLDDQKDRIFILASQRQKSSMQDDGEKGLNIKSEMWCIDTPILAGNYTGTGDLTAALLLAWTAKDSQHIGEVLEKVVSTMFTVIETTQRHSDGTVSGKELKLIQSKKVIEDPPKLFEAKRM